MGEKQFSIDCSSSAVFLLFEKILETYLTEPEQVGLPELHGGHVGLLNILFLLIQTPFKK